jgi:hypothetical protein
VVSKETLIAQFSTLFVGIMITLLDSMSAGRAQGGGDDGLDRVIMSSRVMVVAVTLTWSFVQIVLSGNRALSVRISMP